VQRRKGRLGLAPRSSLTLLNQHIPDMDRSVVIRGIQLSPRDEFTPSALLLVIVGPLGRGVLRGRMSVLCGLTVTNKFN
jgi:hypothetical protein